MENELQNQKCDQCQTPIADAKNAVHRDGKTFCSEACANQATERSGS
jgi:endogenous inhibitor of DNA gyrase (YacG/DUF329 family)